MADTFDVQGARQAGYSDDEILSHLTATRNFDVNGAVSAGYTKPQIIDHLSSAVAPPRETHSNLSRMWNAFKERLPEGPAGDWPEFGPKFREQLSGLATGIANEPTRVYGQAEKSLGALAKGNLGEAAYEGAGAIPFVGPGAQEVGRDVAAGNYPEAVGHAASLVGQAAVAPEIAERLPSLGEGVEATRSAVRAVPQALRSEAAGAGEIPGAVAAATRGAPTALGAMGEEAAAAPKATIQAGVRKVMPTVNPKQNLVQALKPRAQNLYFEQGLDRSMPELNQSAGEMGKPIQGVDDMLAAVKHAKQRVRAQYDSLAGPAREAGTMVDLTPVADSIEDSIPDKLKLEDPGAAKRITELAGKYRTSVPLEQAESFLRTTNDELDSYYRKYPTMQRSAKGANPETALLDAQAREFRNSIYNTLDDPGQGAAPREIQRRYGSLMDMEHELERRRNVAARQAPTSLSEQVGKWAGYGDIARSMVKGTGAAFTGSPEMALSAAGDLATGLTKKALAKWIKEQQTSDTLIRKAFENYSDLPTPIDVPERPPIAGLLGPPALRTPPPPDPSGITVTSGPPLRPPVAPPSRQIGPPALRTPPPPDPSGITVTSGPPFLPTEKKFAKGGVVDPAPTMPGMPPRFQPNGRGRTMPPKFKAKPNQDLITGSSSIPLTLNGDLDARKVGAGLSRKGGLDKLIVSGAERARESAEALRSPKATRSVVTDEAFNPWAEGRYEGLPEPQAEPALLQFALKQPDTPPPGVGPLSTKPGESFNQFRARVLGGLQKVMQQLLQNPGARIGILTHSVDLGLIQSWVKMGMKPDLSVDPRRIFESGTKPGDVFRFWPVDAKGTRWQLDKVNLGSPGRLRWGIYPIRHAQSVWDKNPKGEPSARLAEK